MTVNVAVTDPELPSVTDTLLMVSCGRSSLVMVRTPCASAIVALVAPLRFTTNVSVGFVGRVADDRDRNESEVTPGVNVRVPDPAT